MSALCHALHHLVDQLKIHTFPFDPELFPKNGVYVLLEKGEKAHGVNRIVRIGTHTGKDQLRSRLSQHFVSENKDRSIFRKNIGRALLNQNADSFLRDWNLDLTTAAARRMHGAHIDSKKQQTVEQQVTAYMRSNFRFVVFRINDKEQRLRWESRIISTVARCEECKPSPQWLGQFSSKQKIVESGLWQVNELYKKPFSESEFVEFEQRIKTAN
jgi:hypothetical protein